VEIIGGRLVILEGVFPRRFMAPLKRNNSGKFVIIEFQFAVSDKISAA
jgi:hypothetical protein